MYSFFSNEQFIYNNNLIIITKLSNLNTEQQINCLKTWKLNKLIIYSLNSQNQITSNELKSYISKFIPSSSDLFSLENFLLIKQYNNFLICPSNVAIAPFNFNKFSNKQSLIIFSKFNHQFEDNIIFNVQKEYRKFDIFYCNNINNLNIANTPLEPIYPQIYIQNNKNIYKFQNPIFFHLDENESYNENYDTDIIIKIYSCTELQVDFEGNIQFLNKNSNNSFNPQNYTYIQPPKTLSSSITPAFKRQQSGPQLQQKTATSDLKAPLTVEKETKPIILKSDPHIQGPDLHQHHLNLRRQQILNKIKKFRN